MLNVKLDKEPKNLDLTLIVVYDNIAQVHNTLTYYGLGRYCHKLQ